MSPSVQFVARTWSFDLRPVYARFTAAKKRPRQCAGSLFVCLVIFARCSSAPRSVLCLYFCLLAADAALKEEHVIDGRTIDVKRAVPRDRAPLPRLVRVMRVDFSGWVGDLAQAWFSEFRS